MDLPGLADAFVTHNFGLVDGFDGAHAHAERTSRVVTGWAAASLCSCVLFLGCYSVLPSVRQTPGWQLLRSTVCELIESSLWLAISRAHHEYIHLLWPPLLACDISANGLRLTMYVDLLIVYRNPFSPRRYRPLYYFLIACVALGGTASAVLAGATPRASLSSLIGHKSMAAARAAGASHAAAVRAAGGIGGDVGGGGGVDGASGGARLSGAPDLLVWDLVYLPCLSLCSVGGILYLLMRALLLQRHKSAFAHVSDLARLRAVRHCGAYLGLYGLLLSALVVAYQLDVGHCAAETVVPRGWARGAGARGAGARVDCHLLWHVLAALTAGRPALAFVGWLAINDVPRALRARCRARRPGAAAGFPPFSTMPLHALAADAPSSAGWRQRAAHGAGARADAPDQGARRPTLTGASGACSDGERRRLERARAASASDAGCVGAGGAGLRQALLGAPSLLEEPLLASAAPGGSPHDGGARCAGGPGVACAGNVGRKCGPGVACAGNVGRKCAARADLEAAWGTDGCCGSTQPLCARARSADDTAAAAATAASVGGAPCGREAAPAAAGARAGALGGAARGAEARAGGGVGSFEEDHAGIVQQLRYELVYEAMTGIGEAARLALDVSAGSHGAARACTFNCGGWGGRFGGAAGGMFVDEEEAAEEAQLVVAEAERAARGAGSVGGYGCGAGAAMLAVSAGDGLGSRRSTAQSHRGTAGVAGAAGTAGAAGAAGAAAVTAIGAAVHGAWRWLVTSAAAPFARGASDVSDNSGAARRVGHVQRSASDVSDTRTSRLPTDGRASSPTGGVTHAQQQAATLPTVVPLPSPPRTPSVGVSGGTPPPSPALSARRMSTLASRETRGRVRHYARADFEMIRRACRIDPLHYARAFPQAPEALLGPDWQRRLAESVSEGASGCFFYRVRHADGSETGYLVKQITAAEKRALLRILPAYRAYVCARRGRTLVHYYGCHSVRLRWVASARIYFVVMRNHAPRAPYLVFDLKGATANRRALASSSLFRTNTAAEPDDDARHGRDGGGERGASSGGDGGGAINSLKYAHERGHRPNRSKYGTLRDWEWMDVAMAAELAPEDQLRLYELLSADSAFLASQKVIDYSLLVAVARVADGVPPTAAAPPPAAAAAGPRPPPLAGGRITLDPLEKARVLRQLQAAGGVISRDRQKVYFVGIIDALSQHSFSWVLQANALRLFYTLACRPAAADGITALPPARYAERFMAFIVSEVLGVEGLRAASGGGVCGGGLSARQLELVQRWKHLWVRRRHGLLRERIETERAELTMRIAELEQVIERLHGAAAAVGPPRS